MKIALVSNKGGTGKTTLAVNLAGAMAENAPTLLVDGDLNRSALHWTERGQMPFKCVSETQAPKYWANYQHAIIDTGARPDKEDIADLVEICDRLIVVSSPDALSLDALGPLMESLFEIEEAIFVVCLSMCSPVSRAAEEARAFLDSQEWPAMGALVRRYVAHQRAALEGKLVRDVRDPHAADAWSDIQAVEKELRGQ